VSAPGTGAESEGAPGGEPSEEQLRAAYEEELSRISATDMIAQVAVSLLNVGAYRLAPAQAGADAPAQGGRDLEQARDAIDAVRALLEILERRIPQEIRPLRDALSRLQMTYAHERGGAPGARATGEAGAPAPTVTEAAPTGAGEHGAGEHGETAGGQAEARQGDDQERSRGPGPAESSGRLWVPGR